ncbi:MAG: hypothetical protein CR972_03160 [Candidatus Moraniibacteriota bacterium]|nr:MAG: hypothetical protein CR972_03160 [Candidatus Moranbacteria bacterium]
MDIKFTWTEDMSVHNNVIDTQHKELFKKINELLDVIINDNAEDVVEDMVHFFKQYVEGHLRYEENFLADIGYPETAEHAAQHAEFVKRYKEFKERLDASDDKTKMVMEMENFMGNWLRDHIQEEDKKYATFIAKKNL